MTNNKKNKSAKENKNPTVSIVTISGTKRNETIVLTAEHINNQTYKNIIEWVIVNCDHDLEKSIEHEQFTFFLLYIFLSIDVCIFIINVNINDIIIDIYID